MPLPGFRHVVPVPIGGPAGGGATGGLPLPAAARGGITGGAAIAPACAIGPGLLFGSGIEDVGDPAWPDAVGMPARLPAWLLVDPAMPTPTPAVPAPVVPAPMTGRPPLELLCESSEHAAVQMNKDPIAPTRIVSRTRKLVGRLRPTFGPWSSFRFAHSLVRDI